MHFSFFVTVFAVIFTLTECELNYFFSGQCSGLGASGKGITTAMKQATCNLKPTLQILAPNPDYELDPPMLLVNQCAGSCRSNNCLPKMSRNVTRVVRRTRRDSINGPNFECAFVQIEEHVSCGCMCRTRPVDCHIRQFFDGNKCKCICPNQMEEKKKCEKKMGMLWLENTCDCKCIIMSNECTSGLMWDHIKCECVPNRK